MGSLVVKVKMQILETGLNKGFTILEVLIVLTIIAISGTSFYLILNQPKNIYSYEQIIDEYEILSLYSGNTYGFTKSTINILNEDIWEPIKNENFNDKSNKEALKTTIAALLRGLYNLSQIENNWRRFRGRSKYEKINC